MIFQKGWFVSSREVAEAFHRKDEAMCSYGAWHWMLSEAAFKDHPVNYKGKIIRIKRGELPTTLEKLSKTFKWSINKVRRWLRYSEVAGYMKVSTDRGFSIITICNYNEIQNGKTDTNTETNTPINKQKDMKAGNDMNKKAANNRTNVSNVRNEKIPKSIKKKPQWHIDLEEDLGIAAYQSWIQDLIYNSGYVVGPTKFIVSWCEDRYQKKIETALNNSGLIFKGFKTQEEK